MRESVAISASESFLREVSAYVLHVSESQLNISICYSNDGSVIDQDIGLQDASIFVVPEPENTN
jgi:hypothetical protein